MMRLYCITYGILATWIPAICRWFDRAVDKIFWEIDHNDFLSGFCLAWILFCLAWMAGLVEV